MKKDSRILIVGHDDLVASALHQRLKGEGFKGLFAANPSKVNLTDSRSVRLLFRREKPNYVFLLGAKSGGIMANYKQPAEFIYANLQVQNNVVHSAWETKVKKLLFVASSCVYPRNCAQPMKEEHLLTGVLEPTSEAFAVAKIAGIKMCQYYNRQYKTNFISAIPATPYGPNDEFNLNASHVIPALIRKFYEAKEQRKSVVAIWGTGKPRREFIYADDLADAFIFLMRKDNAPAIINIGTGYDISIRELAELIRKIVSFDGKLKFDASKPDGALRKLLDITRLKALGFEAETSLQAGIEKTYNWYLRSSHGGA